MRRLKREAGLTFKERLTEAVRAGTPVSDVGYKLEGRKIVVVKQ